MLNKIWINEESGDDKIIAIANDKMIKANPDHFKMKDCINDFENNIIPADTFAIPFSYIKVIRLQESEKYIQVFFGKESEEYFTIKDDNKRIEVFNYLKEIFPGASCHTETYSPQKAAKKPTIAFVILIVLLTWTLYYVAQIDSGAQYEIVGSKPGMAGIMLAIASLGLIKVLLIFGSLIGIAVFSMIKKMKNLPVVHDIIIKLS
jgi:hypothetical protein